MLRIFKVKSRLENKNTHTCYNKKTKKEKANVQSLIELCKQPFDFLQIYKNFTSKPPSNVKKIPSMTALRLKFL